jgi:hypothetical protein
MGVTDKQRGKKIFGRLDLLEEADLLVRKVTTTLTAAQIKALNTTPLSVVPAPGASKANVVVDIFAKHTFLTTSFAGSNKLEFRYTSSNGAKVSADLDNALLLLTATGYRHIGGLATDLIPAVNAPITISVPTADPTQGLGSLTVQVFYRTLAV